MKKYKKKPVVIEAVLFNKMKWHKEISQAKLSEAFPMVLLNIKPSKQYSPLDKPGFDFEPVIETLEGNMIVSDGDYIIKGIQGEYYPCKPDIFHDSYEEVAE